MVDFDFDLDLESELEIDFLLFLEKIDRLIKKIKNYLPNRT